MKNVLGLLGYPLSHSFSKDFFKNKFKTLHLHNLCYENFSFSNIEDFFSNTDSINLKGFNVTIPHKKSIINYCNKLSEEAMAVKAVNCVSIINTKQNLKKVIGYNTDAPAFHHTLEGLDLKSNSMALVIGNGGSSSAVSYILNKIGLEVENACRNPQSDSHFLFSEIKEISKYSIVVNCTPIGMYPNIEGFPPLNFDSIKKGQIFYDLVYNPSETEFLKRAEKKGAIIKNGMEMLIKQAELSWDIWNRDHLFIEPPCNSYFKTDIP